MKATINLDLNAGFVQIELTSPQLYLGRSSQPHKSDVESISSESETNSRDVRS